MFATSKWFASGGVLLLLLATVAARVSAQQLLPADVAASVDVAVNEALTNTGAPSASVALVRDGTIVYLHTYGSARLDPVLPSKTDMRYGIGSISKQFTAATILMLAEEKKLSLSDNVNRWLPQLTRSNEVTVSELLSMTSGYQDYWPQDYVMPGMLQPTTTQQIVDAWARKPLDFDPGTKWQYSNTNYVIAGMIAEKAAGTSLMELLRKRIFAPLRMESVANIDAAPLGTEDPTPYMRYALGPLRRAPKEGSGWLFAAAELAMTARDLALWDISMINQTILTPASYHVMQTEVLLKNGVGTGYGLGVSVDSTAGLRRISHGGEVSGFTARNDVYPDERTAVIVLTNLDATGASQQIANRLAGVLFRANDRDAQKAIEQARGLFEGLQHGRIDRSLLTANANAYFTDQALADFASSLGPLGTPQEFIQLVHGLRGGMTLRRFQIKFSKHTLQLTTFTMPDGTLEQYQIAAAD